MNNGDVVYFKRAKRDTKRKTPEVEYKGHGFGVLLGHVPPFQKEPPAEHLLRLMGTIGFLPFDLVAEFLGEEQAAICVSKFEDKFYGAVAQKTTEVPEQVAAPSAILNANGLPANEVIDATARK